MDTNTIRLIFSYLINDCSSLTVVLNRVCRRWNINQIEFDENFLCLWSAVNGFESLCRLSVEKWGAKDCFEYMLRVASCNGDENICKLAIKWGASNFDGMLVMGAKGGHENICRLAKERGATYFDWMLSVGEDYGHENICRLAQSWMNDVFC